MAVTYFRFPRSIRFIMTFDAAFSASSLEALAACFASFVDFGFLLGGNGEVCSLRFEGFYPRGGQLAGGTGDGTGGVKFVIEVRMFAFEPCFTSRQ